VPAARLILLKDVLFTNIIIIIIIIIMTDIEDVALLYRRFC